MYFDSIHALVAMGGHGFYVWTAYTVTAVVLVGLVWSPLRRKRSLIQLLRARQRRQV